MVSKASNVLRIIHRTNIDANEGISNLIFCVLASFYPDLYESINLDEDSKDKQKYRIIMIPLSESLDKH